LKKILKFIFLLVAILLVLAALAYQQRAGLLRVLLQLPAYEYDWAEVQSVKVSMRDGVKLATDIHLPVGEGPWPVVLIRDPYNAPDIFCRFFVRYGIGCVRQDVRGRYDSEGEWYPVVHERDDGLDTLAWLLQQPWQNGNLATYGGSYVGLVQWAMIDAMPPEVKTVVADISHGDWYQVVHRNGHFVQGVMSNWALALHESESTLEQLVGTHPVLETSALHLGGKRQWYEDFLSHTDKSGAYWSAGIMQTIREAHHSAKMPVLMSAGWHDFFIHGQLPVFEELPRRSESALLIRNGAHGPDGSLAEILSTLRYSINLTLQWMRFHLQIEGAKAPPTGYVLQDNLDYRFQRHATWPQGGRKQQYYLDNLAASVDCDGGVLGESAPSAAQASYSYDPLNPVPSRGGSYSLAGAGVVEQGSDLCARADVLSFGSPTFAQGGVISGAIDIALEVSSDAPDSAFTVKLQERLTDGRVLNIRDDIVSLAHQIGPVSRAYEPGTELTLEFSLTPIRWELSPGSTLRLDISSSNYPIYNAHPNVVAPWAQTRERYSAEQTLYGGRVSIPFD
jgi:uncharacterized protein